MLRPYNAAPMEAYAASRVVNSVKNDNEECIARSQTSVRVLKRVVCRYPFGGAALFPCSDEKSPSNL